jgi:hypothetical protein
MDPFTKLLSRHSRRDILKSTAMALVPLAFPSGKYFLHEREPTTANIQTSCRVRPDSTPGLLSHRPAS